MLFYGFLTVSLLVSGITSSPAFDSYNVAKYGNGQLVTAQNDPEVSPDSNESDTHRVFLLIINVYTIHEVSKEDGSIGFFDSIFDDSIMAIPIATILFLVEEGDEDVPVPLDDVAKDFKDAGYDVEKVHKDGETKFVKVDVTEDNEVEIFEPQGEVGDESKVTRALDKIRRRRSSSYKCNRNKCRRYSINEKKHDLYKKYTKGYVYGFADDHKYGKVPIMKVAMPDEQHQPQEQIVHHAHSEGHKYNRQPRQQKL